MMRVAVGTRVLNLINLLSRSQRGLGPLFITTFFAGLLVRFGAAERRFLFGL